MKNKRNSSKNPKPPKTQKVEREQGFNLYYQGANKNLAEERNRERLQEKNQHKRYQSRKKTKKPVKGGSWLQSNQELPRNNKWQSKQQLNFIKADKSPPFKNNKLNNRVRSGINLTEDIESDSQSGWRKEENSRNQIKQDMQDYSKNPTHDTYKKLMQHVG